MKEMIAQIVEEELHSPIIESETHDSFVKRVAVMCFEELLSPGKILPKSFSFEVLKEIEDEVQQVLRKKIYGHYNLDVYRHKVLKSRGL